MTAPHAGTPDAFVRMRASGWIISLCLHGTAVFLAALFAAKVGLAPPSSSFRWDVTVVAPPAAPSTIIPPTNEPQIGQKPVRTTERTRPITPLRSAPPASQGPMQSALTSHAIIHEPQAPTPPLPVPIQDMKLAPQHSETPPRPDSLETAREQSAEEHRPTSVTQSPAEVQEQQTSSPSPIKSSEPTAQSSSSLHAREETAEHTPPPTSTVALAPSTNSGPVTRKPDYGWLAGILLPRIEALKQYPVAARLKHVEGRVLVRIVIQEDGRIVSAAIAKSSGHDTLDQAALETIRKASPITLTQPLEQSQVSIHIPIRYQLGP